MSLYKVDIRLVALDMDGTVLNSKKELTPRTRQAISRAIEAGIEVVPATGRPLSGIDESFRGIPGVRYAVTSNGASVYNLLDESRIFSDCFESGHALEILPLLLPYNAVVGVQKDGKAYVQRAQMEKYRQRVAPELTEYMARTRIEVDDLLAHTKSEGGPVEKFSLYFFSVRERSRARKLLEKRTDVDVTSSMEQNLEINVPHANKGKALLQLAHILGIPPAGVMAVGDSGNDYEMIRDAGYGVAMGNAEERVKQVAKTVTASCDEDGAALALEDVLCRLPGSPYAKNAEKTEIKL